MEWFTDKGLVRGASEGKRVAEVRESKSTMSLNICDARIEKKKKKNSR